MSSKANGKRTNSTTSKESLFKTPEISSEPELDLDDDTMDIDTLDEGSSSTTGTSSGPNPDWIPLKDGTIPADLETEILDPDNELWYFTFPANFEPSKFTQKKLHLSNFNVIDSVEELEDYPATKITMDKLNFLMKPLPKPDYQYTLNLFYKESNPDGDEGRVYLGKPFTRGFSIQEVIAATEDSGTDAVPESIHCDLEPESLQVRYTPIGFQHRTKKDKKKQLQKKKKNEKAIAAIKKKLRKDMDTITTDAKIQFASYQSIPPKGFTAIDVAKDVINKYENGLKGKEGVKKPVVSTEKRSNKGKEKQNDDSSNEDLPIMAVETSNKKRKRDEESQQQSKKRKTSSGSKGKKKKK